MATKKQHEIEHKADAAEWALKKQGVYHLPNDEPGFGSSVAHILRRRYPDADLVVENPPRNFGGEYIFRSASHLGARPTRSEE